MTNGAESMFFSEDKKLSNAELKKKERESLTYNVTEDILVLMEDLGVDKSELARRLSKPTSYVEQTLSGARNLTLGGLSDIAFALGVKVDISLKNDSQSESCA